MSEIKNKINIEYSRPRFWRRVFANLLDIIILLFLTIVIFIPTRSIVTSSKSYQRYEAIIREESLKSGLYKENDGDLIDITYYIEHNESILSESAKEQAYLNAIDGFINYVSYTVSLEKSNDIKAEYDSFRLSTSLTFDGQSYFVLNNNVVVKNANCTAGISKYNKNVYQKFINSKLTPHFLNDVFIVKEAYQKEGNFLLFLEIPLSYALAGFLTYILPTIISRRNRFTLGRLAYKIGLVDKDMLSVNNKTLLIKNLIFYFMQLILSLVTLGIPMLVSFTMIVFSKKSQGFSDYMVGIQEVDLNTNKIYFSKEEIIIDSLNTNNKPVNFKLENKE